MKCHAGCGACCVVPSITQAIPGMPEGKPAGVACINLHEVTRRCRIWGTDQYPDFCRQFKMDSATCGQSADEAFTLIRVLDLASQP